MPTYNYFPATYQPGYNYNPYGGNVPVQPIPQQAIQQQNAQSNVTQQLPMSSGGFVHVQSENEARQYPVAHGQSVTFIDDTANYCYTKTMPFSQFEPFKFKKFKLVEVIDNNAPQNAQESPSEPSKTSEYNLENYALKADVTALRADVDSLTSKIENLFSRSYSRQIKEVEKNEQST